LPENRPRPLHPGLYWITYPLDRDTAGLDELLGGLVEEGRINGPGQTFD